MKLLQKRVSVTPHVWAICVLVGAGAAWAQVPRLEKAAPDSSRDAFSVGGRTGVDFPGGGTAGRAGRSRQQMRVWPGSPQTSSSGTVFDASGIALLSWLPLDRFPSGSSSANDVWGYVSPTGREYAILGLSSGTGFVEVTDPCRPVVIADIPDAESVWSDIAVYGHYAYNVTEGWGGMQIIDLSQIDDHIVTLVGAVTNGLETAHNVFINTESGYAYPCGANIAWGFAAYDLSDPENPQPVGAIPEEFYAHDVYMTSYEDCPYPGRTGPCEIAFAFAAGAGLKIVDITDKTNMTTIATLAYPNLTYCHQGWLTEDRRYVLIDDELDELQNPAVTQTTTYVIDVQDLSTPQFVTSFSSGRSAIDHNLMVRGNLVFEANYSSGLHVFDISDIHDVQAVAYFDTRPEDDVLSFFGAWGVYTGLPSGIILVSDMERGLFVLELSAETGCFLASPPEPEMLSGTVTAAAELDQVSAKNRNISIRAGDVGRTQGIRVRFAALPAPFDTWNELELFAGAPIQICENAGQGTDVNPQDPNACGPAPGQPRDWYWASPLVCDTASAHLMDWTTLKNHCNGGTLNAHPCADAGGCPGGTCGVDGVLHLFHEGIVPSRMASSTGPIDLPASYDIQLIDNTCSLSNSCAYSFPLPMVQAGWGDVVLHVADCPNGPPNESVGVVSDVVSLLSKFSNNYCAPKKARADLVPCLVDFKIGITDVVAALGAFTGGDYEDTCGTGQCGPLGLCKGGADHGQPCTNDDDCSSDPCP